MNDAGRAAVAERIEQDGLALVPELASPERMTALRDELATLADSPAAHRRRPGGTGYALRNVLSLSPRARAFVADPAGRTLIEAVVGPNARPVRSLLFDKTPGANWTLPFHQDLTIAVRTAPDGGFAPGWGPGSRKNGVVHVQPPATLLARMVALRLHLDDCGVDNGPLRVLPGSHRHGRLDADAVRAWRERCKPLFCLARPGDALLMRPLLLHASSPARNPGHRRVLHVEWAPAGLLAGTGLAWHEGDDGPNDEQRNEESQRR